MKRETIFIGVDQGKATETPAIAVVRSTVFSERRKGFAWFGATLLHLERGDKSGSGVALAERVQAIVRQVEREDYFGRPSVWLNVANQGPGAADHCRVRQIDTTRVIVTAGDSESYSDGAYRIPRLLLANKVKDLADTKDEYAGAAFQIAEGVDLEDELLTQFSDFTEREPKEPTLAEAAAGREADDDGLVVATCLAVWGAEKAKYASAEPAENSGLQAMLDRRRIPGIEDLPEFGGGFRL